MTKDSLSILEYGLAICQQPVNQNETSTQENSKPFNLNLSQSSVIKYQKVKSRIESNLIN